MPIVLAPCARRGGRSWPVKGMSYIYHINVMIRLARSGERAGLGGIEPFCFLAMLAAGLIAADVHCRAGIPA